MKTTDFEGAVPYAKTALPVTLLSFESANALWGPCLNPHVPQYSPGGSTGGEGALLALGGRIGIGSDVAGSVRVPAAWSGVYSLRCSTGRWPKNGVNTSMAGQEGVQSVFSPMARTLIDLTYFTRSIIKMMPWKYDYSVHPIPWRGEEEDEAKSKHLRVGLMASDGMIPKIDSKLIKKASFLQPQQFSAPLRQALLPSPPQVMKSSRSHPLPMLTLLPVSILRRSCSMQMAVKHSARTFTASSHRTLVPPKSR